MKEHRNKTAVELADMSNQQQLIQSILECSLQPCSSMLTSHDTKLDSLSTQITRVFNDFRTQLNGVSNETKLKIMRSTWIVN